MKTRERTGEVLFSGKDYTIQLFFANDFNQLFSQDFLVINSNILSEQNYHVKVKVMNGKVYYHLRSVYTIEECQLALLILSRHQEGIYQALTE